MMLLFLLLLLLLLVRVAESTSAFDLILVTNWTKLRKREGGERTNERCYNFQHIKTCCQVLLISGGKGTTRVVASWQITIQACIYFQQHNTTQQNKT